MKARQSRYVRKIMSNEADGRKLTRELIAGIKKMDGEPFETSFGIAQRCTATIASGERKWWKPQ